MGGSTQTILLCILIGTAAYLFVPIWMLTSCLVVVTSFYFRSIIKFFSILPRDLWIVSRFLIINKSLKKMLKQNSTVPSIFETTVSQHANKPMFLFEGEAYSFQSVNEQSDRIAAFFKSLGCQQGDVAAIFMENVPESVIAWIGLSKIGMVSALINYNLRGVSLEHCINISKAKYVITSLSLASHVDAEVRLRYTTYIYFSRDECFQDLEGFENLNEAISQTNSNLDISKIGSRDNLLYIYTSGTTGLPKAAIVTNIRYLFIVKATLACSNISSADTIWTPLPLYHSAAGILALGSTIMSGCTLAFRRKFSASNLLNDLVLSKATVFQYLGEICRYVYATKASELDQKHSVRLILGSGLKKDLWNPFIKRFNIQSVCEIYGMTEGNCSTTNTRVDYPGAIGYINPYLRKFYPLAVVKADPETGEIIRNSEGRCTRIDGGEIGIMIGRIEKYNPIQQFKGYLHKESTEKKIIKDVFKKDDAYFVSGDLLYMEDDGSLYFKDRTGDTFRWKGENVSTGEVEALIQNSLNMSDVIVYGVNIPNTDGKAGMAAIKLEDNIDKTLVFLNSEMKKSLPTYARPLFIRIIQNEGAHLTGTFKFKKVALRKDGFDLSIVTEPLYYYDKSEDAYLPLDERTFEKIQKNLIKF